MNNRILVALAVAALIAGVGIAGAATASADDGKVTICHEPDHQARTMEVSRSAWPSHRDHGDHEGACGDGARAGTRGDEAPPPVPPAPPAHVTLAARADGDVDGEADFEVTLENTGEGDAVQLRLTGRLRGDGEWRVQSHGAHCAVEDHVLTCTMETLEAGGSATVRLRYDGGPRVCHEPAVRLAVEAGNDDDSDDDRAAAEARVGACAVLHRDDPAAA